LTALEASFMKGILLYVCGTQATDECHCFECRGAQFLKILCTVESFFENFNLVISYSQMSFMKCIQRI
jgi:hypothetical protein